MNGMMGWSGTDNTPSEDRVMGAARSGTFQLSHLALHPGDNRSFTISWAAGIRAVTQAAKESNDEFEGESRDLLSQNS
jgi:hypothetical protein